MTRSTPERLPAIALITGLPSAGKTTLGEMVSAQLRDRGLAVEHLDGDALRASSPIRLGFDRDSRRKQAMRAAELAVAAARDGQMAVLSLIAPYRQDRDHIRRLAEAAGIRFLEIHLDTPVGECRRRDGKGLYAAAARGEVSELTGVDGPYEMPLSPDFRLSGPAAPTLSEAEEIAQALASSPARSM